MPNHRTLSVEDDDDDDDKHALFVKDSAPVKFCFHQSVTQGRGQITRDVERHGGQIVSDERQANVLLVDEEQDIEFLRRRYYSSTEVYKLSLYIEPRGFVRECLRAGEYQHIGPRKQGMPGRPQVARRGERIRIPFTEEDREHLAYYLATRCPTRDGRMGNSAYKDLEKLGQTDDPSWQWTRRHTWHSWREHYKMHPDAMDVRINRHFLTLKNTGHHLGYDLRSHDHGNVRPVRRGEKAQEEEEEEEEEEGEAERQKQKQKQKRKRKQRAGRQEDQERRQADPPVTAAQQRSVEKAREHLARREKDLLVHNESDENIQDEEGEERPQRIKHHRAHSDTNQQHESPGSPARRAPLSEASTSKRRMLRVEPEEESEERQRQRAVRQGKLGRVQGDRPTTAVRQRSPRTPREKDVLVCDDGDEDIQDKEDKERPRPVKRHRARSNANRQYELPESPVKQARVLEASSSSQRRASGGGAEFGKGASNDEEHSGAEKSLEIEGSDLFGDREYESQLESDQNNVDDTQDFDFPMPLSPQAPTKPVAEPDGLPMATQETLVASSPFVEKLAPISTPTKVVDIPIAQVATASPPSSLVMTHKRLLVQRTRVRGASAQPGPSALKEARTQGVGVTSDAPYRNTRARSRSVEPQLHGADSQPARQQEGQSTKGKMKGKEKEVLAPIKEGTHEEGYGEGSVAHLAVSNGLSRHDEEDESDEDMIPDLPRFQEIEVEGESLDSDDLETHETLVRGADEGGSESTQDEDENKEDAARVERMASGMLLNRVTRSMTAGPRRVVDRFELAV